MKASSAILFGLLALGLYLLWRSLQNLQSSLGQVGTTLNGELSTVNSGLSTLYAEGRSVGSSLLSPISSLASLGTSAGNGLASLFGSGSTTTSPLSSSLGSNSLFMQDGTPIGNLGDNTLLATGDPLAQGLIPVDGGSLDLHLGGGLIGANSDGSYGSLIDSSPGDGFLPTSTSDDWLSSYDNFYDF